MAADTCHDVGRYRKLFVRTWLHPGFVALTDAEKVLALYLATGPQTNRLGLFVLSLARASEDLGTTPETLRKRLATVCETFGWEFDAAARVFYIPSWWRWNAPENVNVMAGALKDLHEIPPSLLVEAFANNTAHLPNVADKSGRTVLETFQEGLHQRLPKRARTQEQYLDLDQEKEQKHSALRAGSDKGNGQSGRLIPDDVRAVANDATKFVGAQTDVKMLKDVFWQLWNQRHTGRNPNRDDVQQALYEAGLEYRRTA